MELRGFADAMKKEAAGRIARAWQAVRGTASRSKDHAIRGYQSVGKPGRPLSSLSGRAGRFVGENPVASAAGAGTVAGIGAGRVTKREKRAEQILEALQNG